MAVKNYTCIVCPEGCSIRVETDASGALIAVSGNRCARGERYVRSEAIQPVRSISSTVRLTGGTEPVFPVKTEAPVPKECIAAVMAEIRATSVPAPVVRGQAVIADVAGTGVRVVATADAR